MYRFVLMAFACAVACASLFGQATSRIQGVVVDPQGRTLAEAEVKASNSDTGAERTTITGHDGTYVLSSLPIGPYQITVSKPGFATAIRTRIGLLVASIPTVDFELQVGTVSQTVEVAEDVALVETQTTSIGVVVDNKRILELPLNGRNPVELIQLAGAAVPAGKNTTSGFPGGLNISVAGGQLSGINYQLDGSMYNNLLDSANLPFPFPDALQEFKVETSTLTARNGTHASATVSASLKSGTNQIHGSLFEFLRNGSLNARNSFAARRDNLKRNQFGGVVGGPIVKNKLFFFAGYQGTRTRSDPKDLTANVPTAQMLAGDFTGCSTVPATIRDPNGGTFVGKMIPVARFSPLALKVVEFLPKSSDPCGRVAFGSMVNSNEHQILGRVDYTLSAKHQIFGRYMATAYAQSAPYALSGNVLDTAFAGVDDLAQTAALGHTYVASSNAVNQLRLAVNRVGVRRFNQDYFSGCDVGVQIYCGYVPHQTLLGVTGGFNVGAPPSTPGTFIPTYLTLADDLTVVRGSHAFAFGYSGFKYQHSQQITVTAAVQFMFAGAATGFGTTDFLLGQLGTMVQAAPNSVFTNKWGHSIYAQDTWKASRRFTLNYGLRWEPFLPQALNNGAVYNFSLDAFKAGVRSQTVVNAPPGLSYPGDPGFQGLTGVNKRWNQFAPRVGFAFDPRGNGTTSIRASAGIAYDFPNLQIMNTPAAAPPFASRVNINGPVPFENPYGSTPNPFPYTTGPNATFPQFGTFVAQQPDAKGPTTYTWNLSIQHQLGRDWFVSASYLGSQSVHIWVSRPLNPAVLVPGPVGTCPAGQVANCNSTANTNQRRLAFLANPVTGAKLGPVDTFDSGGNSNYHGLILTTQKRLSRGVSVNANYTWSHCIGDVPIGSGVGSIGGTYMDANDRRRDRGNCNTPTIEGNQALDRRHIFNFTTVLESPRLQDPLWNRIASNWRLSASYRFLSASYLTVNTGLDQALTGAVEQQRANQLLEDVFCKPRNANCWIEPAAYGQPAFGTFGNSGRSNVAGPGFFGADLAVSRIFRLAESMSLEARGEAFNVANGVRLGAPITARNSNVFGTVRTALDPRIMQLALKIVF